MWNKLIGVGSVVFPLVAMFGGASSVYLTLAADPRNDRIPVEAQSLVIGGLITMFVSMIGACVLMIVQIVHAVKNPEFSDGERVGWALAIWFLNIFIMPYYWYAHMRPEPRFDPAKDPWKRRGLP